MKGEKCNLVVYTEGKAKRSAYDKLVDMAQGIAEDMSDEDKVRLQGEPTPEMLRKIMNKENK